MKLYVAILEAIGHSPSPHRCEGYCNHLRLSVCLFHAYFKKVNCNDADTWNAGRQQYALVQC